MPFVQLDLLGGDGDLDEDALLGVDDSGAKSVSVSFTNDSLRVTRQVIYIELRHFGQLYSILVI